MMMFTNLFLGLFDFNYFACYYLNMSTDAIYKNMNLVYANIVSSISSAKRVATEYEVLMSNMEHKDKKGILVNDADSYFTKLVEKDAKSNNN